MVKMTARLLLLPFVLLFGATFCGCNTLKEEARATAKSVVDCTTSTALQAINEFGPTVEAVIVNAIDSAGKVDVERVKSATKTYATDTARCVLAATIARFMKPPSLDPNAPQSSPLAVDLVALDGLRKDQIGGQRYKLPDGTTL